MGKWSSFTSVKVNGLQQAIEDSLREYGDVVYQATEEGLAAAEKVLVQELKNASPVGETGQFKKGWKGTGKKYKLARYVGNTVTVESERYGDISLANILEYSTTRGHPFIKRTAESSIEPMADAVIQTIKKEV